MNIARLHKITQFLNTKIERSHIVPHQPIMEIRVVEVQWEEVQQEDLGKL